MTNIPLLHLTLFILSLITTLGAGAYQLDINLIDEPLRIMEGLPFAGTLMGILLVHEMAHYFVSKKNSVSASLPYFIPAPTFIGTMGAFIKMKSPIVTRKALIDIGASGPIAGFIVSIVACIVGLEMSFIAPATHAEDSIIRGDSLLFYALSTLILGVVPANSEIVLHPIAFAGWIGLFVTSLNLIPVGQLDGGHIAYAFMGERHKALSALLVAAIFAMGIFFWEGWILWAVILIILKIKHPPVYYWERPLDTMRLMAGIISLIIFIITFIPAPFSLSP
jgi:membrane-associated protease RseP (regulator of RpoE activity)